MTLANDFHELNDLITRLREKPNGIRWQELINENNKHVLDAYYGYHWTMTEGSELIRLIDPKVELKDAVEVPYIEVDEIIKF